MKLFLRQLAGLLITCLIFITIGLQAADKSPGATSDFQKLLSQMGLNVYYANLHAHHYIGDTPPQALTPGCNIKGQFAQDDGRPCRSAEVSGVSSNSLIPPLLASTNDPVNYFGLACEYAKTVGGLDILIVTAHSKDGNSPDTDTKQIEFYKRHRLLKDINNGFLNSDGKQNFYCGLGQESSSISTGNHINIMGQFLSSNPPVTSADTKPFYFPAGAYSELYSQVNARSSENIILQLNHPGVYEDLWTSPIANAPKKALKELLNDYGLDDFAPAGCIITKAKLDNNVGTNVQMPSGCSTEIPTAIDNSLLQSTFNNIRQAAGDRHRLIEIIGTTGYKEDGSNAGATTNFEEKFLPVQLRTKVGWKEDLHGGFFDYLFYLNMGFKLSPTANQDNHMMNYGSAISSRTGVLAPSLSEVDVYGALNKRRTFATEDRNAKVLLIAKDAAQTSIMGDTITTANNEVTIQIAYEDQDASDSIASLRVFYYKANEDLSFEHSSDHLAIRRIVTFTNGKGVLPTGPEVSQPSDKTELKIKSGAVLSLTIPLVNGEQYFFVEAMQDEDLDKIWSAPIWINKSAEGK